MQVRNYILRIYFGPTPFQRSSLPTTVNWGATLDERRGQLAKQAERMVEHYESELEMTECVMWQGGNIVEF